jgi:hypothetical protein
LAWKSIEETYNARVSPEVRSANSAKGGRAGSKTVMPKLSPELARQLTPETIQAIIDRLVTMAKGGNSYAIETIMKLSGDIGQAARLEITGPGGQPIEHRDLTECSTEELQKMRAQAESCDSE